MSSKTDKNKKRAMKLGEAAKAVAPTMIKKTPRLRWYFTRDEAADMYGIGTRQMTKLIAAGELPKPVKPFGNKPLFKQHEVYRALIERGLMRNKGEQ